jgi:phospholipase C
MRITRRRFLEGMGAAAATLSLRCNRDPVFDLASSIKPAQTALKHVIVLMMENRSFDHLLGWLPGADGQQAGLTYYDRNGLPHGTHALAPDYQGCGHIDPDHTYEGGRIEYNNGACDGWLLANNDDYCLGYYTASDLSFLSRAAPYWTTFDRYFAAIMAETYPNRFYQHCGVTDRLDGSTAPSTLPTIWDRLAERQLDGRYYFSDAPFLQFWGDKYLPIMRSVAQFFADCQSGDLPQVAFVDPRFTGEEQGITNDDHPFADIRAGEYFMSQVYRAVIHSPAWRHTALIINFDEWGGFFDHVPPSTAPDVDPAFELRGFRAPCVLISPFARRSYISSNVYDHTSILRMIEWRWGLRPLSVRDAQAANLAAELDFTSADLGAPDFDAPVVLAGSPCPLVIP